MEDSETNMLEGFVRLVGLLEKNHDFRNYSGEERVCKGCLQSLNFLIYSRQESCIKKNRIKKKHNSMRSTKTIRAREDFKLEPPV